MIPWYPIALRPVRPHTAPDAALALALCGETAPALHEAELLATAAPQNTLMNDVYLPEVKAAVALAQHRPGQVAELLAPASSYALASKVPQLLGLASLEAGHWQQAVTDFQPGVRYRGLALQEAASGTGQTPDYALCLLGTARAQSHFDKAPQPAATSSCLISGRTPTPTSFRCRNTLGTANCLC